MNFRLVLPRTKWWQCLEDLTVCLARALQAAGHSAVVDQAFLGLDFGGGTPGNIEIAIGAHRESVRLPDYPVVIYQTEVPGSGSFPPSFAEKLKRALCVWDSAPNYGTGHAVVEPGWMPTSAALVEKDIPLLFYGSISERRREILTRLHKANLGLECHFNVFGAERDALIDRAKVVVDVKQRETDPNDKTRTFFLDSRGACVLTENDEDTERRLDPVRIVEQCETLLAHPEMRERWVDERSNELQRVDVSAGIAALERAIVGHQISNEIAVSRGADSSGWEPGQNGRIAYHPV